MIGRAWHALQIVCPELGIVAAVPLYLYYLYYELCIVYCLPDPAASQPLVCTSRHNM